MTYPSFTYPLAGAPVLHLDDEVAQTMEATVSGPPEHRSGNWSTCVGKCRNRLPHIRVDIVHSAVCRRTGCNPCRGDAWGELRSARCGSCSLARSSVYHGRQYTHTRVKTLDPWVLQSSQTCPSSRCVLLGRPFHSRQSPRHLNAILARRPLARIIHEAELR